MRRPSKLLFGAIVAIQTACSDRPLPTTPESAAPSASISDGAHNLGNEHFFFLPPLVPQPSFLGVFDSTQAPVVRICEWTGTTCALPLVAQFTTTSGPGSETVRLVTADQLYLVNWHTDESALDTSKTYRITVVVSGTELGHADLDIVGSARELRNVNTREYIPLLDGRTLPIKFRIEEGALASQWIQLSPTGEAPGARHSHSAVLDAANQMLVFGGSVQPAVTAGTLRNDVWRLTNPDGTGSSAWTLASTQGGPPPARGLHTASYDAASDRMIVFGGLIGSSSVASDVWVLANASGVGGTATWTQLGPSGSIPARYRHAAVYDAAGNRLIVYGGHSGSGPLSDVWVLSNANGLGGTPTWSQLPPTGGPGTRDYHAAVYDAANNRMIVFGGRSTPSTNIFNDVWVLSNANGDGTPSWSQLAPSGTPPCARQDHTAIYDAATNRLIVFGGGCSSPPERNDVWVLSGANGLGGTPAWMQLSTVGTTPLGRGAHTALYSAVTNRMIIFGGNTTCCATLSDVWLLTRANGQ